MLFPLANHWQAGIRRVPRTRVKQFRFIVFRGSDNLGEHLEVFGNGPVTKPSLPVRLFGFHPGDQFLRFRIVKQGESLVADHCSEIAPAAVE